jgi:hypothetical protein
MWQAKDRIPNPLELLKRAAPEFVWRRIRQAAVPRQPRGCARLLENWRSSLAKKDVDALGYCYLQAEALRVYWESQITGWNPSKLKCSGALLLRRIPTRAEGATNQSLWPFCLGDGSLLAADLDRGDAEKPEGLLTLVLERPMRVDDRSPACLSCSTHALTLSTK